MKMHTPEYKMWLSRLAVGDKVCRAGCSGWHSFHRAYDILTIVRLTKTQAVCSFKHHEVRFRLHDGKILERDYCWVEPVTEHVIEKNRECALRTWFNALPGQRDTPLHVIEAMKAAYDKAIKVAA